MKFATCAAAAWLWLAGAGACLIAQTSQPPKPVSNEVCAACHEQETKLKPSAHGAVACASCHLKHEEYPHPENQPKPTCGSCHAEEVAEHFNSVHGQELKKGNAAAPDCATCHGDSHETLRTKNPAFHKSTIESCGMCHDRVATEFRNSVHGKAVERGIAQAPVCTDCHGGHGILRPGDPHSTVNPRGQRDTCGRCHGDVRLNRRFGLPADRLRSFDSSFHGLALKSGQQTVASCASCHGVHNILPSSDERSMVHPGKLAATCGSCHPGAGKRFAIGQIHITEGEEGFAPVRLARLFYLFIIPATIGLMLLHHGGDWIRKVVRMRFGATIVPPTPPVKVFRMYGWERVQHGLLVVSFFALAWTGFALKYPDAWWAQPLLMFEATWPVRGTLHRISAVVMVAVSVLHVVLLASNRKLREHWLHLIPRASDVVEAWAGMLFRIGLRSHAPKASHGYIEKIEYWAVVWGTLVMAVTGFALWFNNYALAFIPKEWIDLATTVHFYEAVLATLAIVVWHFYTVIFDPDVYPMDTAWWTGYSPRKHEEGDADQHSNH